MTLNAATGGAAQKRPLAKRSSTGTKTLQFVPDWNRNLAVCPTLRVGLTPQNQGSGAVPPTEPITFRSTKGQTRCSERPQTDIGLLSLRWMPLRGVASVDQGPFPPSGITRSICRRTRVT